MTIVGAIVLSAVVAQSTVPPRDRRGPLTPAKASLTGRVVDDRGAPVPAASVVAIGGPPLPGARAAMTTEDGRFAIRDLEPGLYVVSAERAGYPSIRYGQTRTNGPGKPFAIKRGENVTLSLVMPRGAVIAGTIVGDRGEQAGGWVVIAPVLPPPSIARPVPRTATTGAHGTFRAFGLPAGTYRVFTSSTGPGGTDAERAAGTIVSVAPGDERSGVVLRASTPRPKTYVTVAATEAEGRAPRMFQVSLRRPGEMRVAFSSSRPNPDGTRTVTDVDAGRYTVVARGDESWGTADVQVEGEYPATVAITLTPGVRVRGVAVFDDPAAPRPRWVSVMLSPANADGPMAESDGASAQIAADGTFEVKGVPPGRYIMRALVNDRDGWRLGSAAFGDTDVADTPMTIGHEDIDGVRVTLTKAVTVLSGTITDGRGSPLNGSDVIAFPLDEKHHHVHRSRRVAVSRTTIAGAYELRGLPPGEYGLAVVEDVDEQALQDPAALSVLKPSSRVTLAHGESRRHDFTVAR